MLEVKNLHVTGRRQANPQGSRPHREQGRGARHHGPERLGQVDARLCDGGQAGYEATEGQILLDGEDILAMQPMSAPPRACSWRSSIRWKSQASPP
jgi:Fe-S cluster assembly ATPase SufC